jgi:hypothetical protein
MADPMLVKVNLLFSRFCCAKGGLLERGRNCEIHLALHAQDINPEGFHLVVKSAPR